MKVGITGATGFIGQYLIRDYGSQHEFVAPVRNCSCLDECSVACEYIKSDYSVESLRNIFETCEAVIHLAAIGMPRNREPLKLSTYIENVNVTASVLEACKELNINNIICMSSKAVWLGYEGDEGRVISEGDPLCPGDEYGVSKQCSEDLINFYNDIHDMNIKILRPSEVCGMDLKKGLVNPFWKALLDCCINNKQISIYGTGTAKRELIYVKDVTASIIAGLNKGERGAYNICTGKLTSNMEIAEAFCKVFNNDMGIKICPEKEEWGTVTSMKPGKLEKEMSFTPQYDIISIVEDIKKEYILQFDNK